MSLLKCLRNQRVGNHREDRPTGQRRDGRQRERRQHPGEQEPPAADNAVTTAIPVQSP